jgi:hypothetical protein
LRPKPENFPFLLKEKTGAQNPKSVGKFQVLEFREFETAESGAMELYNKVSVFAPAQPVRTRLNNFILPHKYLLY